ncbi:MAG: hypothetical protein J2P41_16815, partial [Blastocatellia bacterium]|nr:hypothetical protein [Blastocatellia bacterium]
FDPFVTVGYSRLTGSGLGVNTFVLGGGANYWLAEKFGLRFDLRDHIAGSGSLFGLRGGVVFTP